MQQLFISTKPHFWFVIFQTLNSRTVISGQEDIVGMWNHCTQTVNSTAAEPVWIKSACASKECLVTDRHSIPRTNLNDSSLLWEAKLPVNNLQTNEWMCYSSNSASTRTVSTSTFQVEEKLQRQMEGRSNISAYWMKQRCRVTSKPFQDHMGIFFMNKKTDISTKLATLYARIHIRCLLAAAPVSIAFYQHHCNLFFVN